MDEKKDIEELQQIAQYKESGNQDIMAKIYTPYMSLVFGVCLKYLKNQNDAQDAVMNIYEIVSEKIKTHEVKKFRPWLYVVAKNHCFDLLRKKNRRFEKERDAEIMYSDHVFHPSDSKESNFEKLEECLNGLDNDQKRAIQEFYFKEKSYQIISKELNISWNRVRSLIQNGRRMLKNCMENNVN